MLIFSLHTRWNSFLRKLHHGYMKKIGWYDTYSHCCHDYNYKTLMIYQDHLNDKREKRWSDNYIQFSHHH